jgi:hypothetical protein
MNPLQAAARAIYNADPQLGPDGPVPWDEQHTPLRALCIAQARAAIEAIRTPSEAMQLTGHNVRSDPTTGMPTGCGTDQIWTAMIDTLLAEP